MHIVVYMYMRCVYVCAQACYIDDTKIETGEILCRLKINNDILQIPLFSCFTFLLMY